jgi:uncharacterized protein YkwD
MQLLITLFLSIFLFFSPGDKKKFDPAAQWDKAILESANTARNSSFMTAEEQKVIYFINLVRVDPALFGKTFLKFYLDSAKIHRSKYVNSLISDLQKSNACGLVTPEIDLTTEARNHAKDLGMVGKIGHNASDGQSYMGRIEELKKKYATVAETCQYGYQDALSIVIDLLIDEGVEDLGHRRIMLDEKLQFAGAAIEPHKRYKYNCVVEFGSFMQR